MASGFDRDRLRDVRTRAALDRPSTEWNDMIPPIRDIGERLINATRERFSHGRALDSAPGGAPLSRTTGRYETGNAGRVLAKSGILRGSLAWPGGERPGRARQGAAGAIIGPCASSIPQARCARMITTGFRRWSGWTSTSSWA